LAVTLGLSLTAHVGIAAVVFWPRHAPAEPKVDPAPTFAGETFELPAPETTDDPLANASPSPETTAMGEDIDVADAPAHPTPRERAKAAARASHEGRPSGGRSEGTKDGVTGGSGTTPGLYGAVGDPTAQDLRAAFKRAFSFTSSANPKWSQAPLGSLGEVTIAVTLDESGHIASYTIGGTPAPLLRTGLDGAMLTLKNRAFTSKSKVTKLHFKAEIHEGGGHTYGIDANGSFTLPVGHEVTIQYVE
jgi:hypothetical protein